MQTTKAPKRRGFVSVLAAAPGAALALLPSAHCPFCLGAYGALVSSLGVGFLLKERVLAPLIALSLVAGVAAVGWSMRSHHRPGPLVLTIAGSAAIACGRLIWTVPPLVYIGGAVLVGASVWNLWLKRPQPAPLVPIRLTRTGGITHGNQETNR